MPESAVFNSPEEFEDLLTTGLSNASEPVPDGGVPEGNYDARITDVQTGTSRTGGKFLNIGLEILGPSEDLIGAVTKAHFNLNTTGNMEMFKKTLRRLGIATNDGREALTALRERVGTIWSITVKHREQYQNVYFNGQRATVDA